MYSIMHNILYTVSVLGQDKGYTVKYAPSPEGVPKSSYGYIIQYIMQHTIHYIVLYTINDTLCTLYCTVYIILYIINFAHFKVVGLFFFSHKYHPSCLLNIVILTPMYTVQYTVMYSIPNNLPYSSL